MSDTTELISPQAIVSKDFNLVRKGYDANQVKAWLQDVANSYAKLSQDNVTLKKQAKALAEAVKQLKEAAQNTADEPDFDAERQAVLEKAQREADSIRAAAEDERSKMLAEAAEQVAQVNAVNQSQHEEATQSMDDAMAELQTAQNQAEEARQRAEQYETSISAQRTKLQTEINEVKRRAKAISDQAKAERKAAEDRVAELRLEQESIQAELDNARAQAENEVQSTVAALKTKAQAEAKVTRESAQREAARLKQDAQQEADAIIAEAQSKADQDAAAVRRQAQQDADAMAKKAAENESRAAAAQKEAERCQTLVRSYRDIIDDLMPIRDRMSALTYERSDIYKTGMQHPKPHVETAPVHAAPVQKPVTAQTPAAESHKMSAPKITANKPAQTNVKPAQKQTQQTQKPTSKPAQTQTKNSSKPPKKGKSPVLAAAFSTDNNAEQDTEFDDVMASLKSISDDLETDTAETPKSGQTDNINDPIFNESILDGLDLD